MVQRRLMRWLGIAIAVLSFIMACQQPPAGVDSSTATSSAPQVTSPVTLNGAGASFPLFFYERIFSEYRQTVDPNVIVNYQAIGSAAGIQQVMAETVDFGASDVALTDEEMANVDAGVVGVPMTAGMVAIAYNLPGVESGLKLSRTALADIFLGKLTRWTDPGIAETNPGVSLPDLPITPVHRSDGSGTTAVFTAHLSAISSEWQSAVGTGLSISWPTGVGVKANAGVSAQIQQAEGTIGYVEYSYAQELGMPVAAVENQAEMFIAPSPASGAQALQSAAPSEDLTIVVTDPTGEDAYPIVTYSWILAYQQYDDAAKGAALKGVLEWGLLEGQQFSEELGYIPLPEKTVEKAIAAVNQIETP